MLIIEQQPSVAVVSVNNTKKRVSWSSGWLCQERKGGVELIQQTEGEENKMFEKEQWTNLI